MQNFEVLNLDNKTFPPDYNDVLKKSFFIRIQPSRQDPKTSDHSYRTEELWAATG